MFKAGVYLSKEELLELHRLARGESLQDYVRNIIVEHLESRRLTRDAPDETVTGQTCPICDGKGVRGKGESFRECGACNGSRQV